MKSRLSTLVAASLLASLLCGQAAVGSAVLEHGTASSAAVLQAQEALGGGWLSWARDHKKEIVDTVSCFATGVGVGLVMSGGLPPAFLIGAAAAAASCIL